MAYNRINTLKKYIKVMEIVQAHYVEGLTSYAGVFRLYVEPLYPMSYASFMQIVNTPNLRGQLEAEMLRCGRMPEKEEEDRSQMSIFDVPGVEK